ncbi:unnamed protein product [Porites evermanni]|uniref:Uncharacterized protein n=1 Tax=Porites evermanni TaxID=104178 RepID=A0ABN8MBS1_9CNID|nr:unnamed protein product [Porites evermanni]
MDFLLAEINRKSKQIEQNEVTSNKKYFRRGDLAAKQAEEYKKKQECECLFKAGGRGVAKIFQRGGHRGYSPDCHVDLHAHIKKKTRAIDENALQKNKLCHSTSDRILSYFHEKFLIMRSSYNVKDVGARDKGTDHQIWRSYKSGQKSLRQLCNIAPLQVPE